MNRDAVRLDNLNLDTLEPKELAAYRNGTWCRGTKVPPRKAENPTGVWKLPGLIDATPFRAIVHQLIDGQGYTRPQLALAADVGVVTIRDLYDGKVSVQQRTASKLKRLVPLLPSEVTAIPITHATRAAIASGCECDSCRLMARVYAAKGGA